MISRILKVVTALFVGAALSCSVQADVLDIINNNLVVLRSPLIQVGGTVYRDVSVSFPAGGAITVDSYGGELIQRSASFDAANPPITSYDFFTGKLTIPVLKVNNEYFPNVQLTAPLTAPWTLEAADEPLPEPPKYAAYPISYGGYVGDEVTITGLNGAVPYHVAGQDTRYVELIEDKTTSTTFTFRLIAATESTVITTMDNLGATAITTISISANPYAFRTEPPGIGGMTAGHSIRIFMINGTPPFTQVRPIDPDYFLVQQLSEREFVLTVKNGNVEFKNYYLTFRDALGVETHFVIDEIKQSDAKLSITGSTSGYPRETLNLTVTGGSPPYTVRVSNTNIADAVFDQQVMAPPYASIKVYLKPYAQLPAMTVLTIADSQSSVVTFPITVNPRKAPGI